MAILLVNPSDVVTGGSGEFLSRLTKRYGKPKAGRIMSLFTSQIIPWRAEMFRGKLSEKEYFRLVAEKLADPEITPDELQCIFSEAVRAPIMGTIRLLESITASPGSGGGKVEGCTIFIVGDHVKEEFGDVMKANPKLSQLVSGRMLSYTHGACTRDKLFFFWARKYCSLGDVPIYFVSSRSWEVTTARKSGLQAFLCRVGQSETLKRQMRNAGFEFRPQ